MKRVTIFLAILMATGLVKAQTYDSIAHHKVGLYDIDMRDDMIQLRDGSILAHVLLFEVDEQGQYLGDYGNRFYKISRDGAVIMDSIFLEDNDLNQSLVKRNPFDDDNVFAKLVRDLENHRTDLCIRFFDDNLNFKPEKEIWVPVSDTLFPALCDTYMLDEHGDIILYYPLYPLSEGHVFMKVGLDGTVKEQALMPCDSSFPIQTYISLNKRLGVFHMPPAEIAYWGQDRNQKELYIIPFDSALNPTGVLSPDDAPTGYDFDFGMKTCVLDWDDHSFLVASRFDNKYNSEDGVRVTRYHKQSLEAIRTCKFKSQPQSNLGCAFPIGLTETNDSNIYFAYCTQDFTSGSFGNPWGQVSVLKMDDDFNIVWQRFCLEPFGYSRVGTDMATLEDGGVAVGGVIFGAPPELFFLIFDDEGWSVSETNAQIRPYAYYPNPAQDELHLQYSPDVTPKQIELYDLQGRLVKTQRNGLESLNLEGLASGAYTLRVTLENGKVFSDKVVKE